MDISPCGEAQADFTEGMTALALGGRGEGGVYMNARYWYRATALHSDAYPGRMENVRALLKAEMDTGFLAEDVRYTEPLGIRGRRRILRGALALLAQRRNMAKFIFDIEVFADPTCPWCYIGKKTLDKAMTAYTSQHPDVEFKLTWRPYILYPKARASAYEKTATILSTFGPGAPAIFERLGRLGAEHGITFNWEGKTGNSRDAHRLILLAQDQDTAAAAAAFSCPPAAESESESEPGKSPSSPPPPQQTPPKTTTKLDRTTTHLFAAHFEHKADISSRAFLARAAVALDLFATEAAAHAFFDLEQEQGHDDDDHHHHNNNSNNDNNNDGEDGEDEEEPYGAMVDASMARAQAIGVTAVPSYVVQGRWQVGGMQAEGVWLGLFERIRGEEQRRTGNGRRDGAGGREEGRGGRGIGGRETLGEGGEGDGEG
ncbi:hypothetical protein VTK56DRAFT_2545 [Thermocarpiscus australiensis]